MTALRRISWLSRQTEWQYAQSWRDRRGAMAQSFITNGAVTGNALATIWANFTSGSAALAAKAATARLPAETKAKFDEISKLDLSV
jgi:hypothetical protein